MIVRDLLKLIWRLLQMDRREAAKAADDLRAYGVCYIQLNEAGIEAKHIELRDVRFRP